MGVAVVLTILLVGAIAGWLARVLVKGRSSGLGGNLVLGIMGAILASLLLPLIGLRIGGGLLGVIVNATIGATLLLLAVRTFKRT